MATKLQIRRDTAANWTSANPTLSAGEFGFETDTYKLKIGDGSTAWTSLDYYADQLVSSGGVDSAGIISLLGNGSVQHIIPAGNELYDLGDSANRFRDLYLSGSTLNLGGVTLSVDSGGTLTLPEGTRVGSIRVLDSADVAEIAGSISGLDSTGVSNLIDAAYIQSRQITYNTNDFADSAFVTSQINNLIDGAPGTLDTLNEIAAALNDDAAAYDTLLSLINAKTDYDSADTLSLIDSAYIQARQTTASSGVDSAAVTALIDSAYIQARQTSGGGGVDSAATLALIDSDYVSARIPSNLDTGFHWYSYTATAGQTTFQDSDNSGNILSYDPNGILVFYNGVLVTPNDFTASDGSSVVLGTGADSGTNIAITKWNTGEEFPPPYSWGGDRGIFAGGNPSPYNVIEYIDITTPGNASSFGTLTTGRSYTSSLSSTTRGVTSGGGGAVLSNVLDYITISTPSNATDFGDMTSTSYGHGSASDGTTGLFASVGSSASNIIDYITIASPSNASDFGDLSVARRNLDGCSNGTYGVFGGGDNSGDQDVIDYVTFVSPGNATDFGDLTAARDAISATDDRTYGVFVGGATSNVRQTTIDYITIASPSNATDFGDLAQATSYMMSTSNGSRGVFGGGGIPSAQTAISYVTISTPSNASDFGDLGSGRTDGGACSGSPS